MQGKPPYCLPTEETEDCSSEQNPQTNFINSLDQATIIDVWSDNFHEQMQKISVLTKKYNIIAIDTEFPSIEEYNQKFAYLTESEHENYLRLTKNVDISSLIQLGMCLSDEHGNVPGQKFCWQFNFKFQGEIEQISSSSAYLLKKAGINFEKLRSQGISYKTFTHQFIKSGLLLNKKNKWIVFHGGYDFSYMLKLIRNESSPKSSEDFYKSIKIYFPLKIDLKLIIQKQKRLRKLGLSKLADAILCSRIGPQHQAGSDALLTLQCYFKIKHQFEHLLDETIQTENKIFGIGGKQTPKYEPKLTLQYSQGYPYMTESNWQLMQQSLMYYQYPNQYTNGQQNCLMIDYLYQNYGGHRVYEENKNSKGGYNCQTEKK